MDAAVPMDAKNAPTGTWKTAEHAVSHSAHPHRRHRKVDSENASHTKFLTLPRFELFVSQAVVEEASRGNAIAAARRLAFLEGISVLGLSAEIEAIANQLLRASAVPAKARIICRRPAVPPSYLAFLPPPFLPSGLVHPLRPLLVLVRGARSLGKDQAQFVSFPAESFEITALREPRVANDR